MAIRETITGQTFDELMGGTSVPFLTANVTLLAGTNYKRGSVLGKIEASGKFTLVNKTATDGSQTADRVLAYDVDALAADAVGTTYISGTFNRTKLIVGENNTVDEHEAELRDKNIYLTALL